MNLVLAVICMVLGIVAALFLARFFSWTACCYSTRKIRNIALPMLLLAYDCSINRPIQKEESIMKVSALTLIVLSLNSLIDSGMYNSISIDDVHGAIERRGLLRFLKDTCSQNIELSGHLGSTYGDFEGFYEEAIGRIYDAYAGDEGRKWGVRNLGLCLVLAWTNELIQQAFHDADLPA